MEIATQKLGRAPIDCFGFNRFVLVKHLLHDVFAPRGPHRTL
jgi:hypothetical protein